MSLIACRECNRNISSEAPQCPYCGAPKPIKKKRVARGFEWRSKRQYYTIPLIHIAFGRDINGTLLVAKAWIAIGQFAIGAITIAQFGIGLLFGLGQFMVGSIVIAQFAGALYCGIGQIATGYICIGQFVYGYYGLASEGIAQYLWSPRVKDQMAIDFYRSLWTSIKSFFESLRFF